MKNQEKKIERIEMENNNNKQGSNFLNGFLLGALVGAAVVFLFGTKKGKRIWKAISEKGIDNISNILEKADKSVGLDEFSDDDEGESSFAEAGKGMNQIKEEIVGKVKPKIRRFFRGISKRVN